MRKAERNGKAGTEELVGRLHEADVAVRVHAALVLSKRADAVPGLLTALRDEDATVRRLAAWVLGHQRGDEVTMALGAALDDEDEGARRLAAQALRRAA